MTLQLERIRLALRRARFGIATVALAYALSVTAGIVTAHAGNAAALRSRDNLVGKAQRESVILRQHRRGNPLAAAGLDAMANAAAAGLGGLAGYCPPAGYAVAAYRGWIGGIVGVDSRHRSRLRTPYGAFYYLATLILQLIPYSLAGGAGVNLGIAAFTQTDYPGARIQWLKLPHAAIADAGWIYLVALPLFAIASLFEFLM